MAARAGGGLWIGLDRGVARFAGGRLSPLPIRPALEGRVHAIEPVSESALWVATSGEVSRLDRAADGSWRRSSVSLRLPENVTVRSLRLDREGGLWVGTNGGGLRRVHPLPTRRYGAESGLADVAALARDGAGGAFVASGCRTLLHLDGSGAARPVRLPKAAGAGTLLPCGISLAPGPGDSVWVRSGSRLFRLRRHRLEVELVSRDLPLEEGPIVALPDGSVWVASRGGDVRLVSSQGRTVRELRVPAPVMSAALGPDGALWLGGDGAVFRVVGDAVDRFGSGEDGPRGLVRDVVPEPDGTAWIGTYGGGMGRLRAGRVVRLSVEQGLPDNSISRILDDGRGRLWISTNRGLAVVRKSDLEAVADGRARALEPVVFGTERGVAEANFGSPAGFADEAGRLWFGTIAGAVSVDAAAFPFNPTPPAVRIEEIRADGQLHPLGPAVSLPPLTARLRLGFNAFAPLYPERMRYRFRVEGMDADWVEAGAGHTVDWSPPGPGRHRFLVEARNEDGIWSSAPAVVVLDVRPAWLQTTAFRAAAALVLALAVAAGVRRRIRGIERRHADRLRVLEEQRQAEEKVASLRAQLEHVSRAALAGELATSLAHEVRQPIGAIVNNAEAVRRNLPQYLQRPAELEQVFGDIVADAVRASEVVQGLRGFLGSGGPEAAAVDVSALVREMLPLVRRELQDNRVAVELDLAEGLPPVEGLRVQLGQIVVNLVVNACEALAGVEGDRRVAISTAERDGRVELVVSDNGPGLAAEVAGRLFEPFVTTKPEGLGVGLAICRSIAERHGGRLTARHAAGRRVPHDPDAAAGAAPGAPAVTALPKVHVVDDDASMRRSLARLLGGAGHEVALYATAEELLAVAGPALTGCVLLDLRLPGASGLELQDRLAALGCRAPVVFLTGHGDVPASVRAMKAGAVDFLQKPVAAEVLLAAVVSALERGAAGRREEADLDALRALVATLSDRQREVWLRVARGDLNKQIAHDLGLVERTVKLHRAKAMAKLRARSTADLARIAERLGLTGPSD